MGSSVVLRGALAAAWAMAALAAPSGAAAADYAHERQALTDRYGEALRADVYFPAAADGRRAPGRFPVILQYDFGQVAQRDAQEASGQSSLDGPPLDYVKHGYVFAMVDQPGTGGSEGPQGIYDEHVELAGVDAVEWAGTRPWSTGAVGMYGLSGSGIAQPLVAQHHPPHLRTIVPVVTTTHWFSDVLCRGGVPTSWERLLLELAIVGGYNATNGITIPTAPDEISAFGALWAKKLLNGWLPPTPELFPRPDPADPLGAPAAWDDVLRGCGPAIQGFSRNADVRSITVPIWSFGSWDDFFLLGNLDLYTAAGRSRARRLTLDLVGHAQPTHGYDFAAKTLAWYDRWLKHVRNGIEHEPRVDYFTIEDNRWHKAPSWPLPAARMTRLYLGPGALGTRPPTDASAADGYLYDPLAGRHAGTFGILTARAEAGNDNLVSRNQPNGPGDQRLDAPESLVYLGPVLKADTHVTGPIAATLYASTTAPSTDWVVKLVDVFPDTMGDPTQGPQPGYWALATTGWLRAAQGASPYRVALLPTSYDFRAGHRIGVMIASADLSRTYPNEHPAFNTIERSAGLPSHVDLPVLSGDPAPGTPTR